MEKHLKQKFYEDSILPYYNGIYYYALRLLKNKEIAEDVAQSTFEKAWASLDSLKDPCKARSWLFTIARNNVYSKFQRERRWLEYSFLDEILPEDDIHTVQTDALKVIMDKEAHQLLKAAMSLLSDKYRNVLELRYYWEYSLREISEIIGVKYSTARVYIHRALKELTKIYKQLEERGISDEKE